jgi:hypothetical protein
MLSKRVVNMEGSVLNEMETLTAVRGLFVTDRQGQWEKDS